MKRVVAVVALLAGAGCGGGGGLGDASLAELLVSVGTLSPAFAPDVTQYTVGPAPLADQATLTPRAADSRATILVDGHPVASCEASAPILLGMGARTVRVTVAARDGATVRHYFVTFDRTSADLVGLGTSAGDLAPSFQPAVADYAVGPAELPSAATVWAESRDPAAALTVNGAPVLQRTPSTPIPLPFGETVVQIVVTARDGTPRAYRLALRRVSAALSGLAVSAGVLAPPFSPTALLYRVGPAVLPSTATVTPTAEDPLSLVTVNGAPVVSGAPSVPLALRMGDTTAWVLVRSRDGSIERTYRVVFDRTSAALVALSTSAGPVVPAFSPSTTAYEVGPATLPSRTTVTATAADPFATVRVNGVVTPSGVPSAGILLLLGWTPVEVVVTARDGVTTAAYAVDLQRAPWFWLVGQPAPPGQAWRFDTANGAIAAFPAPPALAGASDTEGDLWLSDAWTASLHKVRATDGAVSSYPYPGRPWALAIDADGSVWSANEFGGVAKHAPDGTLVGVYGSGTGPSWGVTVDLDGDAWVTRQFANSVTQFAADGTEIGTYPVGPDPTGIAVDASNHLWVAEGGLGTVCRLDPSGAVVGRYAVGPGPYGLALDADGHVWVSSGISNTVVKLDASDGSLLGTYPVGFGPACMSVTPQGHVFVVCNMDGTVWELDPDGVVVGVTPTPLSPYGWIGDITGFQRQFFLLGAAAGP